MGCKLEFIVVCIGLVCAVPVFGQDPEITERILPEIKLAGLTGRLNCTVINQKQNPVYWIHKQSQLHISKDDKIELDESLNLIETGWPKYEVKKYVDGDRVTYQLAINRLERMDAGLYTCMILYRGSIPTSPSKDGEMIVLVPPSIMQARTSHTVSLKTGDDIKLQCDADGYPSPNITWVKPYFALIPAFLPAATKLAKVRVSGNVLPNGRLRVANKTFAIDNAQPADRGIYRCLADNAVRPPDFYDVTVYVDFKPVARAVQSSYGQAENRMFDITIECTVAGWPEPNLKWFKVESGGNLQELKNDDKHTINILLNHANILQPHERWFQMVIRSVQANDYGDYICEGSNMHGTGQATVNLFATSECQGPNCPEEQETEFQRSLAVSASLNKTMWFSVVLIILTLLWRS